MSIHIGLGVVLLQEILVQATCQAHTRNDKPVFGIILRLLFLVEIAVIFDTYFYKLFHSELKTHCQTGPHMPTLALTRPFPSLPNI